MRRVSSVLATLIASLLLQSVAVPTFAAETCAASRDLCQVTITNSASEPWLVRIVDIDTGSTTTCRTIRACIFRVPFKSRVQLMVASSFPFIWQDGSAKIVGRSGWIDNIPIPADLLTPTMRDGTRAKSLLIDANIDFAVSATSPLTVSQSKGQVVLAADLSVLGAGMTVTDHQKLGSDSFGDWLKTCAIDSSLLNLSRSMGSIGLSMSLVDSMNRLVATSGERSTLTYVRASGRFDVDRRINAKFSIPPSYGDGSTFRVIAEVKNSRGACSSGSTLETLSEFTYTSGRPFIPEQVLPVMFTGEGTTYSYKLKVQGASTKVTWFVAGGRLPDGLVLSRDGVLTGNGALVRPGQSDFTLAVADSVSGAAYEGYSVPRGFTFVAAAANSKSTVAVQDLIATAGCSVNGTACIGGVQADNGPVKWSYFGRTNCSNSKPCATTFPLGRSIELGAHVDAADFASADVVFFPAKGTTGAKTITPLTATIKGTLAVLTWMGSPKGDVLLRIHRRSRIPIVQDVGQSSVGIDAKFDQVQPLLSQQFPSSSAESIVAACKPGGQATSKAFSKTSTAPQVAAVFADDPMLSKPFAVTTAPVQLLKGGLNANSAVSLDASMGNHPSGRIYVGLMLMRGIGEIVCSTAASDVQVFDYTAPSSALTVQGLTQSTAQLGVKYRQQVLVTGGIAPYKYELFKTALPKGLKLDPATGIIAGVVGASGNQSFFVRVTDSAGNTAASSPLSISTPWVLLTSDLPQDLTVGTAMAGVDVYAFGWQSDIVDQGLIADRTARMTYSVKGLPPGLTFDPATRKISGTPAVSGSYSVQMKATLELAGVAISDSSLSWQATVVNKAPLIIETKIEIPTTVITEVTRNVVPLTEVLLPNVVIDPKSVFETPTAKTNIINVVVMNPNVVPLTIIQKVITIPILPIIIPEAPKPTPEIAITPTGTVVRPLPTETVVGPIDAPPTSVAAVAIAAQAAGSTAGTPVPDAVVGPMTAPAPTAPATDASTKTPAGSETSSGDTASSGTATTTAPATKTLTLRFTANKATVSGAVRAAFAAAVKAFGSVSSVTITLPTVTAKNGKPTPASQAVAYLRTQVVKNQLKGAGASTAAVTTKFAPTKKSSTTVTVTLKR